MPIEQKDLLERLLKVFTMDELEMLSTDFEAVKAHGYGGVTIVFDNHHPHRSEPMFSKLLPQRPKTYRAE